MTIYILGTGPAGLAVIDGLVDSEKENFIAIEKSNKGGGLAQTIEWKNIGYHDLGPHKIFSKNKDLINRVENLIPKDQWLTREKISSIFINKHFLPYPPSPFSLGKIFGIVQFLSMTYGYGIAFLKRVLFKQKIESFEDDLKSRLGIPLYSILFKPIAEKLWGEPKNLDLKLSQGRVQTPSFREIILRTLGLKKTSDFEALTFRYPHGGLSKLWDAIENKSNNHGEILFNTSVSDLRIENNKIIEISIIQNGKEKIFKISDNDFVVSTLPIGLTVSLIKKYMSTSVEENFNKVVKLNDLILVFLNIDRDKFLKESWVFIPDPTIAFHRISEQQSFDPEMTKKGTILCCEIMSTVNKEMIHKTDQELFRLVNKGLEDMGYKNYNVINKKVIRLPKSYPVFLKGYEDGLNNLIYTLDKIENFKTIGRQGAFNYIGTLDAMDIGYGFVNWLQKRNYNEWINERERTSLYPVLD